VSLTVVLHLSIGLVALRPLLFARPSASVYLPALLFVCALEWLGATGCVVRSDQRNVKLSIAHYRLGADYLGKKMSEPAKAELFKAIKYDPGNQDAHYLLGVIFFFEGVHAANYLDRLQCLKGAPAEEQRQSANSSLRRARKHLERAVAIGSKNKRVPSEGLNYLANIAVHFKQYDRAIRLADRGLSNILYAHRHLALGTRGWARFNQGDLEGAGRDFRQALFHRPDFCLGRYRLAKVYYAQKKYKEARRELERITSKDPCPVQEAYQLLGLVYLRLGRPMDAKRLFATCVERNTNSCAAQECRRYGELL